MCVTFWARQQDKTRTDTCHIAMASSIESSKTDAAGSPADEPEIEDKKTADEFETAEGSKMEAAAEDSEESETAVAAAVQDSVEPVGSKLEHETAAETAKTELEIGGPYHAPFAVV